MPIHRERVYKPLLFDTTLRNPKRIKSFLSILSKYEGKIPTNEIIHSIVKDVIREKLYEPTYIIHTPEYKEVFKDDSLTFNDEQIEDIIVNSPQDHTEGGFEKGWPSRFFTWYKFPRSLGFAYFDVDKEIQISKTGRMLIKAFEDGNSSLESAVFLNAMARYHRSNPFVMAANTNRPFSLFVATVLRLKELTGNPREGIYRFEIPYFLCWRNNDEIALSDYILKQRDLLGLSPSNELVYDNVKEILGIDSTKERLYKMSNILREMPDEYIRKLRLTGIITLRGGGHYLDIDSLYLDKAEHIKQNYLEFLTFGSEYEYYKYAGEWDDELGEYKEIIKTDSELYLSKFERQVSLHSLETIRKEFLLLKNRHGSSTHELFRVIDRPARLEFLTALLIKKTYPSVIVRPHYPMDDEGIPKYTAGGDEPDISCIDGDKYINVEVTMLTASDQNIRETPSVLKHVSDLVRETGNAFAIFIAPVIHPYTDLYMGLARKDVHFEDCKITRKNIEDFSNDLLVKASLAGFEE